MYYFLWLSLLLLVSSNKISNICSMGLWKQLMNDIKDRKKTRYQVMKTGQAYGRIVAVTEILLTTICYAPHAVLCTKVTKVLTMVSLGTASLVTFSVLLSCPVNKYFILVLLHTLVKVLWTVGLSSVVVAVLPWRMGLAYKALDTVDWKAHVTMVTSQKLHLS